MGLLETIFGARLVAAIDGLARSAGISRGSMSGLLAMLAPIVMSVIGLRVREGGLDSRGLRSMLVDQTHYLRGLVPDSVADQIGMTTLATAHVRAFTHEPPILREPVARRQRIEKEPESRKKNWWLWPLFAAGLLILGLVLLLRGMGDRREARLEREHVSEPTVQTPRVEEPTAPRVEAPRMPRVEVPAVETPSAPREGIDGLAAAMESKTENLPASFEIDGLGFDHASSSVADRASLDRIASLMKEHPQACLEIDGHTDSTGPDEINERLSQARANVVTNALIARGVNSERLQSDGLGESSPIASNDTAEGREQNRRTEVVLESCA